MAHERHADILNHSGLHEARVEGVPQIMDAEVPKACALQRAQPAFPDPRHGHIPQSEHDAFTSGML